MSFSFDFYPTYKNQCKVKCIFIKGTSTWTIAETAKNATKKPIETGSDIEKQYANGTSKGHVLSKLKELCYHSEYVKVARGYCHTKKRGKYYCNKTWKCNRKKQFCQGSVHHSCVYSKMEDGTGKEKNVTIGIILEKVNKTNDAPNEIDTSDNLDMTDQKDEEGGGEEGHEEDGETIMKESQEITTTPKVHCQ